MTKPKLMRSEIIFVMGIWIVFALIILSGCSTVAPFPVVSHSVAWDGRNQNGGIIKLYNDHSADVDQFFIEGYNRVQAKYGKLVNATPLSLPKGKSILRISAQVLEESAIMRLYEREGK